MAAPNIIPTNRNVTIRPAYAYGVLDNSADYNENMIGGGTGSFTVASYTSAKIVNLTIYCNAPRDESVQITIGVYSGSTHVADLFTDYIVYGNNTICLLDEASPIILEENYTLKGHSNHASYCNYYLAYEVFS